MPSNQDVFFFSKWHEIFERYQSARLFLRKANEGEFTNWFGSADTMNQIDDNSYNEHVKWFYKAELFETALINYNMLVDLSWTLTYVSVEFMLYKFDSEGNVTNSREVLGMYPIEESIEMLRKVENGTVAPTVENNPFLYLKKMAS